VGSLVLRRQNSRQYDTDPRDATEFDKASNLHKAADVLKLLDWSALQQLMAGK
jgi:hypothetical protein